MEVGRSESTLATVKTDDVLVGDDGRGMYCFVRVIRTTPKTVFVQTLKDKVSYPPTDAGNSDSRYREFEPVTMNTSFWITCAAVLLIADEPVAC